MLVRIVDVLKTETMKIRVLLNGKKAGLPDVRNAIFGARSVGKVDVRVTWEGGDIDRLVDEAIAEGCERIVAAGGDGTVNEVVNALMRYDDALRPELALMPLGTANDFATACGIPADLPAALVLAQTGDAHRIDCVQAGDQYFANVASGGFGAQVTANTPVALKNFLGGGAYTLSGLVEAMNFSPYRGHSVVDGVELEGAILAAAVCNGPQAGGGQKLAPSAKIDDGLFDVVGLLDFPMDKASQVIRELTGPEADGEFVRRQRGKVATWESEEVMPINLDGEGIATKSIRFEVVPKSIALVVPAGCPVVDG